MGYLAALPLLAPSSWLLFTKIINMHLFPQPLSGILIYSESIATLFISFIYFKAVSHFVSILTEQSQPSCKMTTLGCQVYIFYYALFNEQFNYNKNFFIFQDQASWGNWTSHRNKFRTPVDAYKSKYQFHVHHYNLTKVPELVGMHLSEPHLILGATRTVLIRRRYFSGG